MNNSQDAIQQQPQSSSSTTTFASAHQDRIQLTPHELKLAFQFFSTDGKHITREDIKHQLERYFPEIAVKDYRLLVNGNNLRDAQEPITEDQLFRVLNVLPDGNTLDSSQSKKEKYDGRGVPGMRYEDAFQMFSPTERGSIPETVIRKFAAYGKDKDGHYSHGAFLRQFDTDKDGEIGLEDFKKMIASSNKLQL